MVGWIDERLFRHWALLDLGRVTESRDSLLWKTKNKYFLTKRNDARQIKSENDFEIF